MTANGLGNFCECAAAPKLCGKSTGTCKDNESRILYAGKNLCWPLRLDPLRRLSVFVLSSVLTAYAAGRILSDRAYEANPSQEPALCEFSLCGNDFLIPIASQSLLGGTRAALQSATADFREALRRDPASPFRWCDLAEALQQSGDAASARYCMARAIERGPHSPYVLLRAGNLDLQLGETQEALQRLSRVLEVVPDYDPIIFASYARFVGSTGEVLRQGIPNSRRAAQSYFRYLLREGGEKDLQLVWDWLSSRSFTDAALAGEYTDVLLKRRNYEGAARVWRGQFEGVEPQQTQADWAFNGDFERDFTGCRLDWRIEPAKGAEAALDRGVAYSGARSLRIRFDGTENVDYRHVSEAVLLKPGRYRLQAYVRAEDLTTDEGVGLRIVDPESPARLDVSTPSVSGTSDWKKVEAVFNVPSHVGLAELQVVRRPSLKFDNLIAGAAWVDAVALLPAGQPAQARPR